MSPTVRLGRKVFIFMNPIFVYFYFSVYSFLLICFFWFVNICRFASQIVCQTIILCGRGDNIHIYIIINLSITSEWMESIERSKNLSDSQLLKIECSTMLSAQQLGVYQQILGGCKCRWLWTTSAEMTVRVWSILSYATKERAIAKFRLAFQE